MTDAVRPVLTQEQASRGPDGRWIKGGPSPNPGGRTSPTAIAIRELCREHAPEVVEGLLAIFRNPRVSAYARIEAGRALLEHGIGRPLQGHLVATAEGDGLVEFSLNLGDLSAMRVAAPGGTTAPSAPLEDAREDAALQGAANEKQTDDEPSTALADVPITPPRAPTAPQAPAPQQPRYVWPGEGATW